MENTIKLSDLGCGCRAVVTDIAAGDGICRRLRDLGLVGGTEVACLFRSPLGDPSAFLVRGAVIALRDEDSSRICVRSGDLRNGT